MEKKNNWKAWLYLAPVLILMAVFTFYPLINTILIAFIKNFKISDMEHTAIYTMFQEGKGFTFDNFGYVLGVKELGGALYTDVIKIALPNTFIIVFITVPLSIVIALLISVALNSIKVLGKVFQTIFFIPYVTNAIAIGMVFAVIFASKGGLWDSIFNLKAVDPVSGEVVETAWIDMGADKAHALFALCVYIVWHALPYKILIFLSGLQGIDKQYYQAAKIDAATKFKTFANVTVPLLSPQIVYVLITSLIGSFKEYSSIVGLFGGTGTNTGDRSMLTVVYYIYDCLEHSQYALAAAAAVILFIIIMIFTVIQKKVSDKRVHY